MRFYTVFFIFALVSCTNTPSLVLDSNNPIEVEYGFNDSSVPPEYHRSYIITIQETQIHVIVDSYGDVLTDVTSPLNSAQFYLLVQTINQAQLVSGKNIPSMPCDGGTSESLTISEFGLEVYHGYFDHCADEAPTAMGDKDAVIKAMHDLVPNLSYLLQ